MAFSIHIPDNNSAPHSLAEEQWKDLSMFAGRTVKELCGQDDDKVSLLVFPHSLDANGSKIADSTIIDIKGETITSGNLMGFVGCGETRLRIHSRFDLNKKDNFLHYMLEEAFSANLFDLPFGTDAQSVFDFILFLFPYYLNKALAQGQYREYVTYHHNDDRVRGVIEVSRHIRLNTPFIGKVAYRTREQTTDNNMMELVRHTVEFIRTSAFGSGILARDEETRTSVSLVVEATPSYDKKERQKVISRNLRARIHPYYSEYEPLRRLCLQILRQEEIKYGSDDKTVFGILFDGAWLWELYLEKLLEGHGFTHSVYGGTGVKYLFTSKRAPRYPDFYSDSVVLDAKYKRYGEVNVSDINREDLAQVISYMYIMNYTVGGFLVPGGTTVKAKGETLNGHGGKMYLLNLPIPTADMSYPAFREAISKQETLFLESVDILSE